jgi:multidrug resistance efflux pump
MRPEIAGTVRVINVTEDQSVEAGAVMVELENAVQQADVRLSEADLEVAVAERDRLRNGERAEKRKSAAALTESSRALYLQAKAQYERSRRAGIGVSHEQLDREFFAQRHAEAQWKKAEAENALIEAPARADEMAAAEGRILAARARLARAQGALAKTRLCAPFAGRILRVHVEKGDFVGPNSTQPLLVLADLSKRRVRCFVEELDALRVQAGWQATVTVDGLPGREFAGYVTTVLPRMGKRAPQADDPTEYKDVYYREALIDLDGADDLPLNLRVRARLLGSSGMKG